MTRRLIAVVTVVLLGVPAVGVRAAEGATPAAGVSRVRLHVAGIVCGF